MRRLTNTISGKEVTPKDTIQLFGVFLVVVFSVETLVMLAMAIVQPHAGSDIAIAFLDATLLTIILAPIVWWLFIAPVRRMHNRRGELITQILTIQEEERARIAKDLHDGLGQRLSTVLLRLKVIEQSVSDPQVRENAEITRRIVAESVEEIRKVVRDTRPPVLDHIGLKAAVEKLLADIESTGEVSTELRWQSDLDARLPRRIETVVYRVVQESIANAIKHSNSPRLIVDIDQSCGIINAKVTDYGCGFDLVQVLTQPGRAFGILSMKERVFPFHGTINIESKLNRGTTVHLAIDISNELMETVN